MLDNEQAETVPDVEEKEPAPGSQETISIQLVEDGTFLIDGESVPDLSTLLKHVVAIIKERQSSETAQSSFQAGFGQS